MADLVKFAEIRAKLDPSNFEQGAQRVKRAAEDVSGAVAKIETETTKVGRSTAATAASFERWLGRMDDTTRRGQELTRVMAAYNRYAEAGVASEMQLNIAREAISRKWREYTTAQDDATGAAGRFAGAAGHLRSVLGSLGLVLSTGAVVSYAREVAAGASSLDEQAEQVGVGVEALQAYRAAAIESGTGAETMDRAIAKLTQRIGQASAGTGDARAIFRQLRVEWRDAEGQGRATEAVVSDVARAILAIGDRSRRAALETELFGKSGQKLETSLRAMARPIDELTEHYRRMKLILSDDVTAQANKAMDRLTLAFLRLRTEAAPSIIYVTEKIADAVAWTQRFAEILERAADYWKMLNFGGSGMAELLLDAQERDPRSRGRRDAILNPDQDYRSRQYQPAPVYTNIGLPPLAPGETFSYQRTIEELAEAARLAKLSADERERELAVLRAAQAAQRELGVGQDDLVRSYSAARDVLGESKTIEIEMGVVATQRAQQWRADFEEMQRLKEQERRTDLAFFNELAEQRRLSSLDAKGQFVARGVARLSPSATLMQRMQAHDELSALWDEGEARRRLNQAIREGEMLSQRLRRADEEYAATLAWLNELYQRGAIDAATFARARGEADRELARRAAEEWRRADPGRSEFFDGLEQAFDNAGNRIIQFAREGGSALEALRDVARSVADDILQMFLQLAVLNPLKNALFGGIPGFTPVPVLNLFGAAKGAVFQDGVRLTAYAFGGIPDIVDRPTYFPTADGIGLMGEAGKEAIIPLARAPTGELGVRAQGGGGMTLHLVTNIDARGADAGAEHRIMRALAERDRKLPQLVTAAVSDAKRRGKMGQAFPAG